MAKKHGTVYLGYEDELVSDKNVTLLDHTVNKIGGRPDWPVSQNIQFSSKCPLCSLHRLLIVQCYAPLQNSLYHRTLYVFACINPNCWIHSESWLCVRRQILSSENATATTVAIPKSDTNLTWCGGADDWDVNDNDTANGNISDVDNTFNPNNCQRFSDEDDESNSFEMEAVEQALENLQVFDAHNANHSPLQGAVGAALPAPAAAELEGGDEPGLVTVDTPSAPACDLRMILDQTAELPPDIRNRLLLEPLQFAPKYIYVEEESIPPANHLDDHVTELLTKYGRENNQDVDRGGVEGGGGGRGPTDDEQYEEAAPAHGDRLFHAFLTRLRLHPGQIMRYSLEQPPLLGAPLPPSAPSPERPGAPRTCRRCGARSSCELQLLPAFAEALQLLPANLRLSHLHFLSVLVFTCTQSCWQPGDVFVTETDRAKRTLLSLFTRLTGVSDLATLLQYCWLDNS